MNCNCIDEVQKKLIDQTKDPETKLHTGLVIMDNGLESVLQIPFSYRKQTPKGEFYKRKTESYVIPTYCPFCGKKCKKD